MQAEILLTLKLQQKLFADPRRISLLKHIALSGITDMTGLIGFGLLTAGVYLYAGLPASLMLSGCLLLLYALVVSMRRKHAS